MRSSALKCGCLAAFCSTATTTPSNSRSARRMMSTWPFVIGSNEPGKIAVRSGRWSVVEVIPSSAVERERAVPRDQPACRRNPAASGAARREACSSTQMPPAASRPAPSVTAAARSGSS